MDDFLQFAGTPPVVAPPFTLGAWFKAASDTPNFPTIASIAASATNDAFELSYHAQQVNKRLTARVQRPSDATEAITSAGFDLGAWHSGTAVFAAGNSRAAYGDGGSKGTDTITWVPTGTFNRIGFGARRSSAGGQWFKGHLAYGFLWDDVLTDEEVADWDNGDIIVAKLVAAWDFTVAPVDGVYANLLNPGTYDLTVNGATYDSGQTPPVTYDFGGGGTTPVSADLDALYDLRALAGRDLAAAYDLRALATRDLVAGYDLRALAAGELEAVYGLRALAGADLEAVYDLAALAGRDLDAAYDLRGLAVADLVAVYDLVGVVRAAADLVARYDLRGLAARDLAAVYDLRELVAAVLAAGYGLRALAGRDLEVLYALRALAGGDLDAVYDLVGVAARDLVAVYTLGVAAPSRTRARAGSGRAGIPASSTRTRARAGSGR